MLCTPFLLEGRTIIPSICLGRKNHQSQVSDAEDLIQNSGHGWGEMPDGALVTSSSVKLPFCPTGCLYSNPGHHDGQAPAFL